MRHVLILAAAGLAASQPVSAQTTTGYGSASIQAVRGCPANATTACDGQGTGQGTIQRNITGGGGVVNSVAFDAGANGRGSANVAFGGLGLPEIKLDVYSGTGTRVSNTLFAWQTYTWNGPDEFDILLNATFHIVNSSTDGSSGAKAGGAIATAGFAIWNKADFLSNLSSSATATDVVSRGYLFGASPCGDFEPGDAAPRASTITSQALSGGANQSIALSQTNCREQTLTIGNGDEFVIAGFAQLTGNRGGWADATGTFTIGLDPAIGAEAQRTFASSAAFVAPSAVPEPATWAMMAVGFGAIGAGMRRRIRAHIRFA